MVSALIEVEDLKKYFPVERGFFFRGKKKFVHAVDGVDFTIKKGETLALVGESGCGKTTTARLVLRLLEATSGIVRFMGRNIFELEEEELRLLRRQMQIIFQDPYASLNPRKTISQILSKPYLIHAKKMARGEAKQKALSLLEKVALVPAESFIERWPHELSGGQKQRIGIARALALNPKFIVADEPVSSLDLTVRVQILNLMKDLQRDLNLTLLYITHDLGTVRSIAHRVAVMYLGKIVETALVKNLYENPAHPYTEGMLSATPIPNPRKTRERKSVILKGDVPSPMNPPSGCRFHTRCPYARPECSISEPSFTEIEPEHLVRCKFPL